MFETLWLKIEKEFYGIAVEARKSESPTSIYVSEKQSGIPEKWLLWGNHFLF